MVGGGGTFAFFALCALGFISLVTTFLLLLFKKKRLPCLTEGFLIFIYMLGSTLFNTTEATICYHRKCQKIQNTCLFKYINACIVFISGISLSILP